MYVRVYVYLKFTSNIHYVYIYIYTGLFISPSGTSELDCATTKAGTAERSISIGRESLKVFFCTRGLGVLAGSTARGNLDEKWRVQ